MGLMKINQILKKYKLLHEKHIQSWRTDYAPKIDMPLSESHKNACLEYNTAGNNLLNKMMLELEGHEIFPKKQKSNN